MNLSARDKKTLKIGAGLVGVLLVLGYVILPALRGWSERHGVLASRLAYVANLRERVESQEDLVKQRDSLVLRMGALFEAKASAEDKDKKAEGKDASGADKSAKDSAKPEEKSKDASGKPEEQGSEPSKTSDEAKAAAPPGVPAASKPEEAAKADGEKKPEEAAKPDGEKKPEEVAKPDGEKKPEEAAKPDGEKKPEDAAKPDGEKKPEEAAKPGGEKKPEEGKGSPEAKGDPKKDAPQGPKLEGTSLAGYVEQSAKASGVTIKSMAPGRSSAGRKGLKHYESVMLQVKVDCNIKSLITLLQTLEKGERFVKVEQLQLRRDAANEGNMDVTLDVRAYEPVARPS